MGLHIPQIFHKTSVKFREFCRTFGSDIVVNALSAGEKVKNITKDVISGWGKIFKGAKDGAKKIANSDAVKKSKKFLKKASPVIPVLLSIPLIKYL